MDIGILAHDASRVVLDSLADGVYITDVDRNILFWNKSAERLTGWRAGDMIGRSCFDDILAHQDAAGHPLCGEELCPLHRAIVCGQASRLPVTVFAKRRDGRRVPVEVTVAPVRDTDGEVIGGIESFRDLTPLMQDLERARIIQEHAMRTRLPDDDRIAVAVHNVPVEFVSGDFYRVEALDADTYALLLADVTGHGLIDLRDRELRYIRAGHTAPLLVRNAATITFGTRSPALGLLPFADFPACREQLEPGDAILLYTDGASEVRNQAGEELGEDGLRDVLMQETGGRVNTPALRQLEEALLTYSGSLRFDDDLTLLGIELACGGTAAVI